MSNGICTLANDRVYDQLVALLNSIEANGGKDLPVCVYPYDDQTEEIAKLIAQR
ncbi:MAG: sugar transferase, partial [Microcystis aeruginosa PMC 728.11]|nr:sugar transferase [Microcystis aeruginosa PMC 728.11]